MCLIGQKRVVGINTTRGVSNGKIFWAGEKQQFQKKGFLRVFKAEELKRGRLTLYFFENELNMINMKLERVEIIRDIWRYLAKISYELTSFWRN